MQKRIEDAVVEDTNNTKDKKRNVLSPIAQQALKEAQARKRDLELAKELNGPKGLEPTRYGDWEAKGRCYDF